MLVIASSQTRCLVCSLLGSIAYFPSTISFFSSCSAGFSLGKCPLANCVCWAVLFLCVFFRSLFWFCFHKTYCNIANRNSMSTHQSIIFVGYFWKATLEPAIRVPLSGTSGEKGKTNKSSISIGSFALRFSHQLQIVLKSNFLEHIG